MTDPDLSKRLRDGEPVWIKIFPGDQDYLKVRIEGDQIEVMADDAYWSADGFYNWKLVEW